MQDLHIYTTFVIWYQRNVRLIHLAIYSVCIYMASVRVIENYISQTFSTILTNV